jgi:CRISPR-associated protein Csm4
MPMAKWQLVKLDFQANPVHFGEAGIGLEETSERVHSDTLFSAWVSSYARLYPSKITDLFKHFSSPNNQSKSTSAPFRVSSTFIYNQSQSGTTVYYLPTLLHRPHNYPLDDLSFAKTFRKLKFVPLNVWQRWYQGKGFDAIADRKELEMDKDIRSGQLTTAGTFNYGEAFMTQTLPKVAVDRTHHGTNFYQTGFTYFQSGAGLYFLFQMPEPNETLLKELQASLNLLADEGIGGERSSGAGRFHATWSELSKEWKGIVDKSIAKPHYALISLLWDDPAICADLVADESARYQLQERGGWIAAGSGRQLRRKFVRMFGEGSVFSQQPHGKLATVTPQKLDNVNHHPIYRSGVSLSLPVVL